ncbi:hypothetical protein AAFF_G00395830 [Aldrovandia affinis]|uniref:Reverse transcriptase domain-containing protein n=1 Tax=Aldrovandia affinis TaxID=143900 RepID=A0AAD7SDF9_9TELE|nr:hypothetical protein AAFF_G00395830 [Aldrovandia affinis]
MDFLMHRPQRVLVNSTYSDLLHTSTGPPQGCVLSPLLFILYTDDCRTSHTNCHLVKFVDDTVLLSLLSGPAQDHGPALDEFMEWCDTSCLKLNVTKTKEKVVVVSSRQQESRSTSALTFIHGEPVEVVQQYKYLGTVFR